MRFLRKSDSPWEKENNFEGEAWMGFNLSISWYPKVNDPIFPGRRLPLKEGQNKFYSQANVVA